MLVEQHPEFAYLGDTPYFETYMHVGAIAPDIQWILPVHQGHGSDFSLFLIEQALTLEPRFLVMAIGHLLHNSSSDPLCEQFWTPTLVSSAPLGMLNLLDGYSDAKGMSEGLTEVIGDVIVGDWDALIDMAYDIYFDGEEAQDRGYEAITWYVNQLNAFYGTTTDPDAIWASVLEKITIVEGYVGGATRQEFKDFFHSLKGETPADVLNFLTGDLIKQVAGSIGTRSADYDINVDAAMNSAVVEQSFWDIYQDTILADLSSFWFMDRVSAFLEDQTPENLDLANLGWPSWNGNAIISGNVMSVMQMLPDIYDVVPGLIVDEVTWMDMDGHPISAVSNELMGGQLKLRVRFYSAYDFAGTVSLAVLGDLPGLDQSFDIPAGSQTMSVTIDPRQCVPEGRRTIETTFTVGAALVEGFYFELRANDNPGAWLTSNWDSIIASGKVPVNQAIYRDNFATYGKWPPSLPVTSYSDDRCLFMVHTRTFPEGGPIAGAAVSMGAVGGFEAGEEWVVPTAPNGNAAFDLVAAGVHEFTITPPEGFVVVDASLINSIECNAAASRTVWTTRDYHVVPQAWIPGGISGRNDCIKFNTNAAAFFHKAERFQVSITNADGGAEILPMMEKNAKDQVEVCFPTAVENGTYVKIHLVPKYKDGFGLGVEGVSEAILIDSTSPIIESIDFEATGDTCDAVDQHVLPFTVNLYVKSEVSPVAAVAWAMTDSADVWNEAVYTEAPGEIPFTSRLTVAFDSPTFAPTDGIIFRVTNGIGTSAELTTVVPENLTCPCGCEVDTEDIIVGNDTVVTDNGIDRDVVVGIDTNPGHDIANSDVIDTTDNGTGGGGGGCSSSDQTGGFAGLALLMIAFGGLIILRRRTAIHHRI